MPERSQRAISLAAMSLLWNNPNGDKLEPWLDEVKAAGYDGVAGFAEWGWQDYLAKPAEFGRLLANHGLKLASMDIGVHANFDQYRQACRFMAELGARHLVCLGGWGKEPADFAALGGLLNRIGEIALEFGVHAVYHNHTGNTGETFEDMDRLLACTDPGKFFVMCDTGHATKDFVKQPVAQRATLFLEKYWDRLDFIEFKDWNPETDLNTPLGEGQCDFAAVFGLLKAKQYKGWITVEQNGHEGRSRGRLPLECAKISREFIRKGMGV